MSDTDARSGAASALSKMAAGLQLSSVPGEVVERAKLHILDGIGLGLASNAYEYGQVSACGVTALSAGVGDCSVIGRSERLPVRDAALLNGILIHGLDFDDTHLGSIIHPTCTALPVALSLGESLDVSGADLLAAFVAGAETGIRIGAAVNGAFHHVGYHATGIVSHFAAAVTAGRLLGLSADQITTAQGITGSTASGIQVFLEEGAWTKRFHPGWGAVAGITAAILAKHGFKGPLRPYEGKFGLFDTHLHGLADELRPDELTAGLGDRWLFGETALKPYPVCHFIHGCADAALELHREIGGARIARVTAFLPQPTLHIVAEPAAAKERPTTDYEAKFSAQFVVAYCLLRGRFGLPDLRSEALEDKDVLDLARRVRCVEDPDSVFPKFFSGGVEIALADGSILRRHVRVNSGAGERSMTAEAVTDKFFACASMHIGHDQAEQVCGAVMHLEQHSVREIMALLRA
jgi:2-methylcitrate dehydratase PrpD